MSPLNMAVVYWGVTAFFLAVAMIVLIHLFKMDLNGIISELDATGKERKPSLSRFQFLLFTFIVAGVWITLCFDSQTFVEIPPGVLGLIGLSGGSYVVSKGISKQKGPTDDKKDTTDIKS